MSSFILNGFCEIPSQIKEILISHCALPEGGTSVSKMKGSLDEISDKDCLVKIQRALLSYANGKKKPRSFQRGITIAFHKVVDVNIHSANALFSLFVQKRCLRSSSIHTRIVEDIETPAFKDSPNNIDYPVQTEYDIRQDCVFCVEHKVREEEPFVRCENCHGSGFVKCERCDGTGREQYVAGNYANGDDIIKTGACPECEGTGKIPCPDCKGEGRLAIYAPKYSVFYSVDEVVYHELVGTCWFPWSSSLLFSKNSFEGKQKAKKNSEFESLGLKKHTTKKELEIIETTIKDIKSAESVCYKNRLISSKDFRPRILEDMSSLGFKEAYETNTKICDDHIEDDSLLVNLYEQHYVIPMKRLTMNTSDGKTYILYVYEASDGILHISMKNTWSFVSGWEYFWHVVYYSLVRLGRSAYRLVVKP